MKILISIILSLITIANPMSLSIGTHFCGGIAIEKKILLGDLHLGCDMPNMEESCDKSTDAKGIEHSFENTPCCQNEFQTVQVTDEFVNIVDQQSFNFDYAVAIISTIIDLDIPAKSTPKFFAEYISPPLEKDVQVLFQTFLI